MSGRASRETEAQKNNKSMNLKNLLTDRRSNIIKKWRELTLAAYPGDAQRFLKKEKNRFANPVGRTIGEAVEVLYDELLKGGNTESASSALDRIIRIRAVQDLRPSQAIGFILQLKGIIGEELRTVAQENGLSEEIQGVEHTIDNMALMAFDIYTQCRQKIYEIRVSEVQSQVSGLLRRANLSTGNVRRAADFEKEMDSEQ
jgi:hypothetical protein